MTSGKKMSNNCALCFNIIEHVANISEAFYANRDINVDHSIFRTILEKTFFALCKYFPCLILQETILSVVPYQEVNLRAATFSCKRRLDVVHST